MYFSILNSALCPGVEVNSEIIIPNPTPADVPMIRGAAIIPPPHANNAGNCEFDDTELYRDSGREAANAYSRSDSNIFQPFVIKTERIYTIDGSVPTYWYRLEPPVARPKGS